MLVALKLDLTALAVFLLCVWSCLSIISEKKIKAICKQFTRSHFGKSGWIGSFAAVPFFQHQACCADRCALDDLWRDCFSGNSDVGA